MTYFAISNHRNCYKLLCVSSPSDLFDMFIRVTGSRDFVMWQLQSKSFEFPRVKFPTFDTFHVASNGFKGNQNV